MSAYASAMEAMTEGLLVGREGALRTLLALAPANIPARALAEARAELADLDAERSAESSSPKP